MCGICGFVRTSDDGDSAALLRRMSDTLVHRGPDDAGMHLDGSVALGHRRLSILDLTTGQQPLATDDGRFVVVFNGEIYNHRELRTELQAAGRHFRTTSDTETIVHAYAQFGPACVERLDGMFAFVLYDRERQTLFGARDRCGKKPLFYVLGEPDAEEPFAFASEIKSLLELPSVRADARLSERALASYLLNDYVPGEQRIYANVRQLGAGQAFEFGLPESAAPGLRTWTYWDRLFDCERAARREPSGVARPGVSPGGSRRTACSDAARERALGDELLRLLRAAVERRMVADVPVGALLSGGVDSSAIVALMTEFRPADRLETFSIGFDEPSFDESQHAAHVARFLGTRHRTRRFTAAEMLRVLPEVLASLDEPYADPSLLPFSMLCSFARQYVTVALSGDGGDELFAGYDPFRAVGPAERYRRWVPRWLHERVVRPLARWLPASSRNMSLEFKVARFLRGVSVERPIQAATWMGPFSLEQLQRLAPDLVDLDPHAAFADVYAAHDKLDQLGADTLDQTLDFFQRFYLPDDILVKVDRGSMLHSLEVRSPLLDTALVEFANALPHDLKLRRGRTKWLFKQALLHGTHHGDSHPLLPPEIVHRKKKGFGIPIARWIRHELQATFRTTLVDDWPGDRLPQLRRGEIERLFREHLRGERNHAKELWALFVLACWIRDRAPERLDERDTRRLAPHDYEARVESPVSEAVR